MSGVKLKNKKFLEKVGYRVSFIIEKKLNLSLPKAARLLGYENPSTLYKSRAGETMLHPEKLIELRVLFRKQLGQELDLHWLLTGEGDLFYDIRDTENKYISYDIIKFIEKLSDAQKNALKMLMLG